MKQLLKRVFIGILSFVFLFVAMICGIALYYYKIVHAEAGQLSTIVQPGKLGKQVNPFSGTGGFPWMCAYNHPGPQTPYGLVRLCPETASILLNKKAVSTSGYFYGDDKIIGFSHTRLSGTGATDGGHFLVVPTSGEDGLNAYRQNRYFRFSHKNEIAFPGYYSVKLRKPGVIAELTATSRVGVHRYTFDDPEKAHLLIDVGHALGHGRSEEGIIRLLPEEREIEGSIRTFGSFSGRYGGIRVYFVARFDKNFDSWRLWNGESVFDADSTSGDDIGVDVSFAGHEVVQIKLAISYISVENARLNLQAETEDTSFEEIVKAAKTTWERKLRLIEIEGGSEEQRRVFYTALYRAFQMPTHFEDVNGDYLGFDGKVHKADGFRYFTDMSLWDTFRTTHPLYTLIAPADQRDMLVSLAKMAEQGGGLPRWPSGGGYTGSMLGSPADIVIAESWIKGIRDFDVETAYAAMRAGAAGPPPKGAKYSGRRGIGPYIKYRYCPSDLMDKAVSKTLEYAWADHSISLLASALGRDNDAVLFAEQAQNYRNLWNPKTQYFQPKNTAGQFEEFDPLKLTYTDRTGEMTNDYVEGSALQWRWGVFFDPEGLISLFDSRDYFVSELNSFFEKANNRLGWWFPGSYYWHGNQPDIHAAYLFNTAGRPDLTQKWVRWILDTKHGDNFIGLDGNDDGGTLSAWYIFSALEFYPVAGTDIYQLGAPLFEKAVVNMGDKTLVIVADNYAPENLYMRRIWLNEKILERSWIRHSEIIEGGVLRFEMDDIPAQQRTP